MDLWERAVRKEEESQRKVILQNKHKNRLIQKRANLTINMNLCSISPLIPLPPAWEFRADGKIFLIPMGTPVYRRLGEFMFPYLSKSANRNRDETHTVARAKTESKYLL